MKYLGQSGMGAGEMFIGLLIICALTFGGVKVASNIQKADDQKDTTPSEVAPATTISNIVWKYNDQQGRWVATGGQAPACENPVSLESPVDISKVTNVLYPGQYRGGNYKPHGGFGFANSASTDISVRAPLSGKLTGLVRYIEGGEIQYLLTFTNDCGIAYRFDHVYALSDKFAAIAATTPEPKADDTRGLPLKNPVAVEAGELVATAVGHPKTHNIGIDFGVYDYRSPNQISQNAQWAALHQQYKSLEWYGRCWFDLLPADDAKRVKSLKPTNPAVVEVSDYCSAPGGTTLDHNGGRP